MRANTRTMKAYATRGTSQKMIGDFHKRGPVIACDHCESETSKDMSFRAWTLAFTIEVLDPLQGNEMEVRLHRVNH